MITWPVFCWLFYKLLIYTLHLVLNFMPTKIYEYSIIVLFELWFPVYFLAIMQGLQVFPVSLSAERNSLYIYLGGLTNSPRVKIKTWRKKWLSGFRSLQLNTPTARLDCHRSVWPTTAKRKPQAGSAGCCLILMIRSSCFTFFFIYSFFDIFNVSVDYGYIGPRIVFCSPV